MPVRQLGCRPTSAIEVCTTPPGSTIGFARQPAQTSRPEFGATFRRCACQQQPLQRWWILWVGGRPVPWDLYYSAVTSLSREIVYLQFVIYDRSGVSDKSFDQYEAFQLPANPVEVTSPEAGPRRFDMNPGQFVGSMTTILPANGGIATSDHLIRTTDTRTYTTKYGEPKFVRRIRQPQRPLDDRIRSRAHVKPSRRGDRREHHLRPRSRSSAAIIHRE